MKHKISIVVPVYKVEEYLPKCIESLINQTFKDIEIILVNDGSPDNCPEICDDYSKRDARIKVIHKKNGGLSDARNEGVRVATGSYILFVDSDDYIELDTCRKFMDIIGEAEPDIIVGNAKKIEVHKTSLMYHHTITEGEFITGQEYLKLELMFGTMHMATWLNLYRRNFLIENNLEFRIGLLHEDEEFTPRVFLKANKVIGTDIIFYNYLIRDGSITNSKNKIKNAKHIIQTCKELEVIYNNIEDNRLRLLLNDNLVNKILNVFQVAELHRSEFSHLVDYTFLKNKAYTKKNKMRVLLFKISKRLYYHVNKNLKKLISIRYSR